MDDVGGGGIVIPICFLSCARADGMEWMNEKRQGLDPGQNGWRISSLLQFVHVVVLYLV